MASSKEIINEHDSNLAELKRLLRGKLNEQRDALTFIKKLPADNQARADLCCDGKKFKSKCEELIEKRDNGQNNKTTKKNGGMYGYTW